MVDKQAMERRLFKLEQSLRKLKELSKGFRNILVHDYLEVDPKIVYENLKRINDFNKFAKHVLTWL